jgi:hypothetical protein
MLAAPVDLTDGGTTERLGKSATALPSQCQWIEDAGAQNTPTHEPTLEVSPGDLDFR